MLFRSAVNRNHHYKNNSVGLIVPNCEVKILDPVEGIGEVLVRGDQVFSAYLDDPILTNESFVDGWFRTGDMGYMDDEGFLYITGRCKNIIVLKNGKNINPEEIEVLLLESPLLAEALVFGEQQGENGDSYLVAEIYPDPHVTDEMTQEDLIREINVVVGLVNESLVFYKRIHHFELRFTPFLKTTSKKIIRHTDAGGN